MGYAACGTTRRADNAKPTPGYLVEGSVATVFPPRLLPTELQERLGDLDFYIMWRGITKLAA